MRQGYSGHRVELDDGIVKKWTRGKESAPQLIQQMDHQSRGLDFFSTILPCPILSQKLISKDDYFEFTMPYIGNRTLLDYWSTDVIDKIIIGIYKNIDTGLSHGDLGPTNILYDDYGNIFLIDYIKRETNSAFNDVISFDISTNILKDKIPHVVYINDMIQKTFNSTYRTSIKQLKKKRLELVMSLPCDDYTMSRYKQMYSEMI